MARKNRISLHSIGDDALLKVLNRAPDEIYRKVVRKSMNRATTVMRKHVQAMSPVGRDDDEDNDDKPMRKSFKKQLRLQKRSDTVWGNVGLPKGYSRSSWHVLRGTKPHAIGSGGNKPLSFAGITVYTVWHPGQAANPFMQKALAKSIPNVIGDVKVRMRKELKRLFNAK